MFIDVLYTNGTIVRIDRVSELPEDLSEICSLQIVGYTPADAAVIERRFAIDTAILNAGEDIEISSHYREKDDQIALNFSLPYLTPQKTIDEATVCFIMKDRVMFSFMAIDFEQFIHENQKQHFIENIRALPFSLDAFLMMMVGIFSDYFADLTEQVAKNIRAVYTALQEQRNFSEPGLDQITKLKFNSFSIKESLTEFRRVLHLLRKSKQLSPEIKDRIHAELNDLLVINEYVQNNIERLSDLKEYVSGKIDIEQNRVFKTLTIVTLCISAPMLIAGIYGMNFKYMPELEWKYGYAYVLVLIVLSFLIPLIWFKRNRWLK